MRARKLLSWVLAALAASYVLVVIVVWTAQDGLVFHPQPPAIDVHPPAGWRIETVRHTTADGTALEGVLVLPPIENPRLTIYYGGNAEETTSRASQARDEYGERALLLMNYRGYGRSGGRPSERALVADALEVRDAIAARPDIDARSVLLHGRSLGTGVAVQVAAARPACGVVLTSPYARLWEVARDFYPLLPVAWIARHRFDSLAVAPAIRVPLLVFIGERDTIIGPAHSERLASAWGGAVERVRLPGRDHQDLGDDPLYRERLRNFASSCR